MQKITFSKFNNYVSSEEELTEEQLTELFGAFFSNPQKTKELKAQKDKLLKAAEEKKKQIDKEKNDKWAAAKNRASGAQTQQDKLMWKSTTDMRAGEGRAVDRNPFGV